MDEKLKTLVMGIILTVLIINTSVILALAFSSIGQVQESDITTSPSPTTVTVTTTLPRTPVADDDAAAPSVTKLVPTPTKSYVYIEAAPVTPVPTRANAALYEPPKEKPEEYVTIYSLNHQNVTESLPRVSFRLTNPPLIIDYAFIPNNITDIKYLEYKILSTPYKINAEIRRPDEDSWFRIIARNRTSGEIAAEDGVGKLFSLNSPKQFIIYKKGNYRFEFSGQGGVVNLTMRVKREGNIL